MLLNSALRGHGQLQEPLLTEADLSLGVEGSEVKMLQACVSNRNLDLYFRHKQNQLQMGSGSCFLKESIEYLPGFRVGSVFLTREYRTALIQERHKLPPWPLLQAVLHSSQSDPSKSCCGWMWRCMPVPKHQGRRITVSSRPA